MAIWDLYVDESGSFQYPGEHTLIGGVLIPHCQNSGDAMFVSWQKEIRSKIEDSGVVTKEMLTDGDLWHHLLPQGKNARLLAPMQAKYDELQAKPKYVFDHCCENRSGSIRWKAQYWCLQQYMKKLESVHGIPVVFDNPDGKYHIDSNSTFMTIMANGVIRLYNYLRQQAPGEGVSLYIHAASRLNVTRTKQPELYGSSPVAGVQDELGIELYINQIRNCIFLNGGHRLLELNAFNESLDHFELLRDHKVDGYKKPNPVTVICDYVCNSVYSGASHPELVNVLKSSGLLAFDVFDGPLSSADYSDEYLAQNHDWGRLLTSLISYGFPKERTALFFTKMDLDVRYDQTVCVQTVVDYLYSFIQNRENMLDWIERLQQMIEMTKPMKKDAYLELKSNLLIYLNAMYTHLGENEAVRNVADEFVRCAMEMKDTERRDKLLQLFCNRQIVSYTDLFQFEAGEAYYRMLQRYFRSKISNSENLLADFIELTEQDLIPDSVNVQYGRSTGSYIQLLTKHIRFSKDAEEQKSLKEKAAEIIPFAFSQFTKPTDISFCHQNVCDLLVQLERYEEAMSHLCKAVCGQDIPEDFIGQAVAVLAKTGVKCDHGIPFVYLHYVSMMHRALVKGSPRGNEMLKCLISVETLAAGSFQHLKGNPHPGGVILWHLAASLSQVESYQALSKELFDAAWQVMEARGFIFRTIGLAIHAQEINLGQQGKLPGKRENWLRSKEILLKKDYPDYASKAIVNPYSTIDMHSDNALTLMANMIAY